MAQVIPIEAVRPSAPPQRRWAIAVALVFLVALGVRLPHLADPPDGFHTMRQYHGQLLARWLHDSVGGTPSPSQGSRVDLSDTRVLEPPVLPALSAAGFVVTGAESWWVPRSINIAAWLLAGWMLLRLTLELTRSRLAAVSAAAWFLLAPFGISLSRSIQPDALMLCATVGAWYAAERAVRAPSRARLVMLGLATAAAVFLKAVAGVLVVGVVVALLVRRHGWSRPWTHRPLQVVAAGAAVPLVMYYGAAILSGAPLQGQFTSSVVPSLLGELVFWTSWLDMVLSVVGVVGLLALVIASTIWSSGELQGFLVGATVGYGAMAVLFSYRSATHDYYAAPLLAVVAVAVGVVAARGWAGLRHRQVARVPAFAAVAVVLVASILSAGDHRSADPAVSAERRSAIATATSGIAGEERTLMIDGHYGNLLRHDAQLIGAAWPTQADLDLDELTGVAVPAPEDRLDQLRADGVRHLVTTVDLTGSPDPSIRALGALVANCTVVESSGGVLVVDLADCSATD